MTDDESKKCETKGAGGVQFDKGSGTTVPPSAWVSVTCISVLLLFAVGPLGFSLQEKKQADRAASRKGSVLRITWNSDGMVLASASSNQTVKPMDGAVGKPRTSLEGYTGDVYSYSVAWSPDGKTLASGSRDRTIRLWDAATGKVLASLEGHTGAVYSVAWSPDGKTVASGSGDQTVKLWDAATGKLLSSLRGHTGGVYTVAWSPDGKTLASGSDDRTVKLWDAAAGKERLR